MIAEAIDKGSSDKGKEVYDFEYAYGRPRDWTLILLSPTGDVKTLAMQ